MRNRRVPRPAGGAVSALVEGLAPVSGLAALQRVWPDAVGDVIAAQAHPAAERDGVVTVNLSRAGSSSRNSVPDGTPLCWATSLRAGGFRDDR